MDLQLEPTWKEQLQAECEKEYFQKIVQFLKIESEKGKIIYPESSFIFNAFTQTPFNKVHVLLLGQDPYHGVGQAHGLCFSVQDGIKIPPSLKNMYKELHADLGKQIPNKGNLIHWAQQGVLMLNASLTVEAGMPMSHSNIGWEVFTDAVIKLISDKKQGIIFLLWGKFAQEKAALIDSSKHYILIAPHPSPLSAYTGFFGCRHFSKTNELLKMQGKVEIDW